MVGGRRRGRPLRAPHPTSWSRVACRLTRTGGRRRGTPRAAP